MDKNLKNSLLNYKYFNSTILPIILFILTKLVYGFYYDTNDDFIISLLLKGDLQPQGGAFENFYIHKFLTFIYTFLYSGTNLIPWYGAFLCFFNLIATINIFYLVHQSFSKYFNRYLETLILILLYFILILDNVALINFNKTAIILGGSSTIVFLNLFLNNVGKKRFFYYTLLLTIFTFAFFTRPPAAILAIIFILPFVLFMLYRLKKFKQSTDTIFTVTIYILLLLFSFAVTETKEQSEREKFNTSWVNATEFNSTMPIDLSNKQDSIKLVALNYYFAGDRKIINDEYMGKISTAKLFTLNKISILRFNKAVIDIMKLFIYNFPGVTILNMCLVFILSIYYFKKKRNLFIIYLIVQISFILFLLLIDVFMKLPTRLFSPLYVIYTLSNLLQLKYIKFEYRSKKILFYTLLIVSISFAFTMYSFIKSKSSVKTRNIQNEQILNYIDNKYRNTVFLVSLPACTLLECLDPLKIDYFSKNKMLPIVGWTTIMPSFSEELTSITGSPQLRDLFQYIKRTNEKNILIISDEIFIELLQSYFKIIYNDELRFVQLPEKTPVMRSRNLYFYTIEK